MRSLKLFVMLMFFKTPGVSSFFEWTTDISIDMCIDEKVQSECEKRPRACRLLMSAANAAKERDVRICLVGRSGVGKSSMVNSLRDVRSGESGAAKLSHGVSGTGEREGYEFNPDGYPSPHKKGVVYIDMPGSGTTEFEADTYAHDVKLATCDALLLVLADRVYSDDVAIFKWAKKRGITAFVARNKVNLDADNALRDASDDASSGSSVITRIKDDIAKQFDVSPSDVYGISALWEHRSMFEMLQLKEHLYSSMCSIAAKRAVSDADTAPFMCKWVCASGVSTKESKTTENKATTTSSVDFVNPYAMPVVAGTCAAVVGIASLPALGLVSAFGAVAIAGVGGGVGIGAYGVVAGGQHFCQC